jgi:uncharacterized protein HemY
MISLETAQELIRRSRYRSTWLSPQTLILLLIGAMLGGLLANPKGLTDDSLLQLLVPQALLVTLAVWMWSRARRQQRTAAAMTAAWEAVQLKDWGRAEAQIVTLLHRPIRPGPSRLQSLMVLAAVAESQKQYAVSQHILESILQEPILDRSVYYAARIALAGTLLRTHQLTDAVRMIDKLAREELPDAVRAQVELLSLFRGVYMGQVEDAIERADERRTLFRRHLSTRAGYGYALLAAAFERADQTDRAAQFWRDATLLLSPTDILDRFGEVATVAKKYPATEWPV